MSTSDPAIPHGPRPAFTLALLLAAAGLLLGGGVWLARRDVERRIPADRALLREAAAALQEELTALDALYLGHLRRISALGVFGNDETAAAEAAKVEGVALLSSVPRHEPPKVIFKAPGTPPPEPELTTGGKRTISSFAFAVPREPVFGSTDDSPLPQAEEGWIMRDPWLAWWRRLDSQLVMVFVLRPGDIRAAADRRLTALLPAVWAPVRAAGGMERLEGHGGKVLAGAKERAETPPDFVVPLASRLGDWQIVSWDRRVPGVQWHQPTLLLAGILSTGVALLGWFVAGAQRRALQEVTARVSFVNRVSHELGAPLTNLRLSMDLARDSLPPDAAESDRRLAIAQEETGRLARLVDNVLTFARGERGKLTLHPAPCQPAEILRGVQDQFAAAFTRRGIAVETEFCEGTVALDADALAQIAANLISNVEKYAASGRWMRMELECGDALTLRVHDRGPGIPATEAARLFLPFERLDSRLTEGVSGTGLGLSIARELAARMGGSLEYSTRTEGGSCFTLRVPLPASNP